MKEKDVEDICRKIAIEEGFIPYFLEGKKGSEGVPDMMLVDPDGEVLFFEIKLGSSLRPNQKLFLARVGRSYELRWSNNFKQPLIYYNPEHSVGFQEYLQFYKKVC